MDELDIFEYSYFLMLHSALILIQNRVTSMMMDLKLLFHIVGLSNAFVLVNPKDLVLIR